MRDGGGRPPVLEGRRVTLRALVADDFPRWQEVRRGNHAWLTPWEPSRPPGSPDVVASRTAFAVRCQARERERQLGTGHSFGVFVDSQLCGEVNVNGVQRGPFQSANVGYWIDQARAGRGYTPEALVVVFRHAFEDLGLHRLEIAIIPRNGASCRVVEKLGMREEGVALRFLEINGRWEDHLRFAITLEDWRERSADLLARWVAPERSRNPKGGAAARR